MNPYIVIDAINNSLYKSYNILSNGNFFLKKMLFREYSILSRNKELKDISSESCIICGNGPSIKKFRFDIVSDIPVFTVNYFLKGDIELKNNKHYHILIDDAFTKKNSEAYNYLISSYLNFKNTNFIFRFDMQDDIKTIEENASRAYFIYYKNIQYKHHIKFDMENIMTACHNVVLMAIQCAFYMGYKKIYLIGCENNFFTNYTHFYDETKEEFFAKPSSWSGLNYVDMAFKHYDAIRAYADKNGIQVINITPNSYINSFKEIPLEQFYIEIGKGY